MKKILGIIITLFLIQCAHAQGYLKSKEEITKYSDKVIVLLRDQEYPTAFEELHKYWPLPENELDQLESQTLKQFNLIADRFGRIIGSDFIKDKSVKDFVLKKIYVLRFEKHMIRVVFTYYKNDQGWILNGFKWDDEFDELFD